MSSDTKLKPISTWIATGVLLAFAAVIWLPAVNTPFWGDDYMFLLGAREANITGQPWWSAFWPETRAMFWRPLSQESWWRFVDIWLGADAQRTHMANLTLLILASSCVGILALTLARACAWSQPVEISVLSGVIYATLALHLLPVHWAAAANNSMLVIFTALLLASWIAASRARKLTRALLFAAIPVLLTAALLCKESAALTPLLMVVLSLFVRPSSVRVGEAAVWVVCIGLVALWLVLRAKFTAETEPAYDLVLDTNLIRNGLSLVAWLFNVPREALRLIMTSQTGLGLFWIAITSLPMAATWAIAMRNGLSGFPPRNWMLTLGFILFAYAPYFLLAWNSYAYYAAIAAILPTVVLARGLAGHRRAVIAAGLIGLSSYFAVAGTRLIDHPGLIGRARWAEDSLQSLEGMSVDSPLWVHADDAQRFYAMGVAGLAWRLGLHPRSIHLVDACPKNSEQCLVIEEDGHLSWKGHLPARE